MPVYDCATKMAFWVDILHKCRKVKYVYVNPRSTAFVRQWRARKEAARREWLNKPEVFHLNFIPTDLALLFKWHDKVTGSKLPHRLTATVTKIKTLSVQAIDKEFPSNKLVSRHCRPGSKTQQKDKYSFHRMNKVGLLRKRPHYAIWFRLHSVRSNKIEARTGRHTKYFTRARCTECASGEGTESE